MKHSRHIHLLFKFGFTVGAFWFALRDVDFPSLSVILQTQALAGIIIAAAMVLMQVLLGGLRWRLVLAALLPPGSRSMSMFEATKQFYIGVFFNCCLPGTVGGDVIRVWMAKTSDVPLPVAINSVIIDRLLALLALGLLVLVMLPVLADILGFKAWLWFLIACIAILFVARFIFYAKRLLPPYRHVRLVHWVLHFIDCVGLLLSYPKVSAISLTLAVVAHIFFCLCAYALAQSMGIDLTFLQCLTLIPLVLLLTTIPISIGGWGLREASMVGILGFVGVSQTAALTLSVEIGLIHIVISLPAALLWVLRRRRAVMPGVT